MDHNALAPEKIRDLFERKYSEVSAYIATPPPDIESEQDSSIQWSCRRLKDLIDYNARDGKRMRGLAVASSYLRIAGKDANNESLDLALVVGWAIEIFNRPELNGTDQFYLWFTNYLGLHKQLQCKRPSVIRQQWFSGEFFNSRPQMQASFLVADDIMDQSETRRGKLCWYKNGGIGLQAINDGMLLESCIYKLLRKYCRTKSYYSDLTDLFREVVMLTELGQSLDMDTSEKPEVDFSSFTDERYISIVKYKTSFYSFYLPVASALYIVQDDFIDCFGDPSITGKIGKDIEDNKCTWLIVQALKRCSQDQRTILENNYGKSDSSKREAVVQVYRELNMEEIFHQYEKDTYDKLQASIKTMRELNVPPEVFMDLLNTIYQRKK